MELVEANAFAALKFSGMKFAQALAASNSLRAKV